MKKILYIYEFIENMDSQKIEYKKLREILENDRNDELITQSAVRMLWPWLYKYGITENQKEMGDHDIKEFFTPLGKEYCLFLKIYLKDSKGLSDIKIKNILENINEDYIYIFVINLLKSDSGMLYKNCILRMQLKGKLLRDEFNVIGYAIENEKDENWIKQKLEMVSNDELEISFRKTNNAWQYSLKDFCSAKILTKEKNVIYPNMTKNGNFKLMESEDICQKWMQS